MSFGGFDSFVIKICIFALDTKAKTMGVTFDNEKQMFVFDFEHDGAQDIVHLTGDGYQVEAFDKCFYYGYEFSNQVDGNVRSAFISYVYNANDLKECHDITDYIKIAIDNLHRKVNLYNYIIVICPESKNRAFQYMMRYVYRFAQPKLCKVQDILNPDMDEKLCASIRQQNVLIIDDVTTSGSTLNEILRTLRILNEDNEITIFSLIGRKDLMVEAV